MLAQRPAKGGTHSGQGVLTPHKRPNELGNYKKGDPVYGGVAFLQISIFYSMITCLRVFLSRFPLVSLVPLLWACDVPPALQPLYT